MLYNSTLDPSRAMVVCHTSINNQSVGELLDKVASDCLQLLLGNCKKVLQSLDLLNKILWHIDRQATSPVWRKHQKDSSAIPNCPITTPNLPISLRQLSFPLIPYTIFPPLPGSSVPVPAYENSSGKSIPTLLAVKRTRSSSSIFIPGLYRSSSVAYILCAFTYCKNWSACSIEVWASEAMVLRMRDWRGEREVAERGREGSSRRKAR